MSRGGVTPKIHALTDGNGLPIKSIITPGNIYDIQAARELLADIRKGQMVLGGVEDGAERHRPMTPTGSEIICPNAVVGPISRPRPCANAQLFSHPGFTSNAISSSNSSTVSGS
jgi:hypothetical protein